MAVIMSMTVDLTMTVTVTMATTVISKDVGCLRTRHRPILVSSRARIQTDHQVFKQDQAQNGAMKTTKRTRNPRSPPTQPDPRSSTSRAPTAALAASHLSSSPQPKLLPFGGGCPCGRKQRILTVEATPNYPTYATRLFVSSHFVFEGIYPLLIDHITSHGYPFLFLYRRHIPTNGPNDPHPSFPASAHIRTQPETRLVLPTP
jgi:hypothetical protein